MTKTAVVILNWNGIKFLKQFLPGVINYTDTPNSKVYVADNGSTDESVQYIKENHPEAELVLLDKNYGFTGGYNRALTQIDAEYFILLNSDIEVSPNWLAPLEELMDKNKNVAACMPKIRSFHQKEYFEYAGAAGGFIDKFGYPFCRGRILNVVEEDKGQFDQETEVFWATGACMMVRAELYKKLNGLDEDFFAHMEEIDLCWRLKNLGYNIMYQPKSTVYHIGGGTLPNNTPRKVYFNYRNNLFLLYKNLPSKKFRSTLLSRMVLDGMSAGIYLLKGEFGFFGAVFKAHMHFYKSIKDLRKKRKQITQNKIESGMYNASIVFSFFIRNKKKFNHLNDQRF